MPCGTTLLSNKSMEDIFFSIVKFIFGATNFSTWRSENLYWHFYDCVEVKLNLFDKMTTLWI